jgi:steroid delta-isomerase-like uncharacterized protein
VVRAHVEAEAIQHNVAATIATFRHPRYEIPAFGVVADGAEAVENLLNGFLRAFPDLWLKTRAFYHSDNAVFIEVSFGGTHGDTWAGVPATGKQFEVESLLMFTFEGEHLMGEKLYLDHATILRQLGMTFR